MKFWTPKIRTEQKNWSVILNPLRGELDRKRVAEKVSELFRLSFEEARELVRNTPLILLDELPHQAALQIQNIFQEIRADVTLTCDSLAKRRCYRAVWPEPPNLSFLDHDLSGAAQEARGEEMILETSARTFSASVSEEGSDVSSDAFRHLEKKYKELQALYEKRMREIDALKQGFGDELKQRLEKNSAEFQNQLQDWEDRYQSLREEYKETKAIYEEKILVREKEFEALGGQLKELEELKARAAALQRQNEDYENAGAANEGKILTQTRELEALREQLKDLHLWQGKAATLERQNREFLEKFNHLESVRQGLEQTIKEHSEAVDLWREKYQTLVQKSDRLEALYEEERRRREQVEEARRQVSELAERTRQNLEIQVAETERWRKSFQELDQNQKRLKEEFSQSSTEKDTELKQLRQTNQSLEKQLESAQRQVRDLLFRVEQLDLIEKRTRLTNELGTKEARLRELMLDGERLRQEAQDKGLRAQTLENEQGTLEREILEIKQAQRHLSEQTKVRDKNNNKLRRPAGSESGTEND